MKSHHVEYSSRFESLETALTSLHVAASKSSTSEPVQLFQIHNVKLDFLVKLMQSRLVQDYYREFTALALANRIQGIIADALLDCFLSDLKIDIQRDVIVQNPTSWLHAVSLAKLFEEKYLPKQETSLTHPYPKYQP